MRDHCWVTSSGEAVLHSVLEHPVQACEPGSMVYWPLSLSRRLCLIVLYACTSVCLVIGVTSWYSTGANWTSRFWCCLLATFAKMRTVGWVAGAVAGAVVGAVTRDDAGSAYVAAIHALHCLKALCLLHCLAEKPVRPSPAPHLLHCFIVGSSGLGEWRY